jgi:hypothetical protein
MKMMETYLYKALHPEQVAALHCFQRMSFGHSTSASFTQISCFLFLPDGHSVGQTCLGTSPEGHSLNNMAFGTSPEGHLLNNMALGTSPEGHSVSNMALGTPPEGHLVNNMALGTLVNAQFFIN